MGIPALIVKEIVSRQVKKQAIRVAQRKLGYNKVMGLVRRFDKRKTFVQNMRAKPLDMLAKLMKEYAKRKVLGGFLPPLRYINNWRKYGIKECMIRLLFKATPTELKKPLYFIKGCKNEFEKYKLITEGKEEFWKAINSVDQKKQAQILNQVVKFDPKDKELKEYWTETLDYNIIFFANSPMTHNFDQLPMRYNNKTQRLLLFARGYGKAQIIESIVIENVEWDYIYRAMKGADFGRIVYNEIRSGKSWLTGRKWAMRDPNYHPKTKR